MYTLFFSFIVLSIQFRVCVFHYIIIFFYSLSIRCASSLTDVRCFAIIKGFLCQVQGFCEDANHVLYFRVVITCFFCYHLLNLLLLCRIASYYSFISSSTTGKTLENDNNQIFAIEYYNGVNSFTIECLRMLCT